MAIEIVTKEDLETFRMQLLQELQKVFIQEKSKSERKVWLRSGEVCEMLNISVGTLHSMCTTGKLKFSKVGHIHFYRLDDIDKFLSSKIQN